MNDNKLGLAQRLRYYSRNKERTIGNIFRELFGVRDVLSQF